MVVVPVLLAVVVGVFDATFPRLLAMGMRKDIVQEHEAVKKQQGEP